MNIVIAAGGTAGHINPGISIAKTIMEKVPSAKIYFIGTEYGLERKIVSEAGFDIRFIHSRGLSKNLLKIVGSLFINTRGIFEAKNILTELNPKIVIGMGGYVCAPVLFAAKKILNIPVFIHESNAIPGKTNRFIAGFADGIAVGFEKTKEDFKSKFVIVTGNPINQDFYKIARNITDDKLVLIFGGSQGSRAINNAVIELLRQADELPYKIIYATGQQKYNEVLTELKEHNIHITNNVEILPYINNMPELLSKASLVVSRAGALTITELSAIGTPAILIPLPTAAENHQEINARMFEKEGRGKVLLENELTSTKLKKEIDIMLKSDVKFNREEYKNSNEKFFDMIKFHLN